MTTTLDHAALPMLEALTPATGRHFKRADIFPNDFLTIEQVQILDEDGVLKEHWVVAAKAFKPHTGVMGYRDREEEIISINGHQMLPDWHGPSNNAARMWMGRIPEKRELGFGKYRIAITDFSALVIHASWPADKIIFVNQAAHLSYTTLVLRFHRHSSCARRTAAYKVEGILPPLPEDYVDHPDWPLLEHQIVPLVNSLEQEAYGLFMDPGTCKTSTVIARVMVESGRKRQGFIRGCPKTLYRVLVVCPNQVRTNWANEFEQFATAPGKYSIIKGDHPVRVRRILKGVSEDHDCNWGACIIGWDTVEPTLTGLLAANWDLIVLDESHMAKNSRTQRWKAINTLCEKGRVRQRTILTGTPIANTPVDLWAQFELLGRGLSGFHSFRNFKAFHGKYVTLNAGGTPVQKLVGMENVPLLQERLARLTFMITKDECFDLPEKSYDTVEVEMTKKQAEWYRQIRDQLALELEEIMDSPKRMSADHVLTKLLRLAQITSGFVKWDRIIDPHTEEEVSPAVEEAVPDGNPKEDMTIKLIKEGLELDPKGKKIVWCCFRHDIFSLMDRLDKEGIRAVSYFGDTTECEREAAVEQFNKGDTQVFVANAQTAGAGLNLLGYDPADPERFDTYTDHELFYSQTWQPVLRTQAEDRAHRKGTRGTLRITDLVVPGTIDEEIRKRVTEKQDIARALQDVREILKNVLYNGAE